MEGAETDMSFTELPFSEVRAQGSPLQKRILDSLREKLGERAAGEDCLRVAVSEIKQRGLNGMSTRLLLDRATSETLNSGRSTLSERFPGLRSRSSSEWMSAATEAVAYLDGDESVRQPLLAAITAREVAEKRTSEDEIFGARMLRLLRTAKTIYLENKLRKSGDKAVLSRFLSLRKQEAAPPLE
jgi:hypothetical protein